METSLPSHLVMLGAAPETRGSIASVVEAYREHGLFKRWPIDYIATHGGGGFLHEAKLLFKGLRSFAVLLARHRRVVVHAHCAARRGLWREWLFAALAVAARCPVIVQLHGGGFERFYDASSTPGRIAIRLLLERAACVVAPSESQCAWVRRVARGAHAACLPNPVPVQAPASQAGRSNLVLFLGRLEAGKGVFDLLDSVAELRGAVPDLRVVFAGEGDRAALARYAERLGIADAVKFTGQVGPSGKRALLESAAAFVLPSYAEGLPLGLLEAMAAGVAVIASPVGGVPEAVVDGVSGFLVAPGDTAALSRLLRKLLLDRELGARLGAAARESVRLRFSPDRTVPRLEEIYAEAGLGAIGKSVAPARDAGMREAA
jgi:glycosyltransferase involved in cell wall biosynthesis